MEIVKKKIRKNNILIYNLSGKEGLYDSGGINQMYTMWQDI